MATPPKRNYGPMAGSRKKTGQIPGTRKTSSQVQLGSAYNSGVDPRGPDAYVPVPVNPTQRARRMRVRAPKASMARYSAGGGGASAKLRKRTGDAYIG